MPTAERTLPAVLRAAAARHPDGIAVLDPFAEHGPQSLSFGELLAQVRTTARALVALGLSPGERVALWAPNSARWVVAALATTYAGATLVPLNTRYTGHEVAEIVARVDARIVVLADGFLGRCQHDELLAGLAEHSDGPSAVPTVVLLPIGLDAPTHPDSSALATLERDESTQTNRGVGWGELARLAEQVAEDEVERRADAVQPDDVADILFTSGTTGRSKGACTAHRQTVAVADTWASIGGVTADDRYLVVNPFFHTFGYKAGIVVGLLSGATIVPQPVFDVDRMLELIEEHRITVLPGAPAIYHSLLEAPAREKADLSSLRLAVTGAATVPVALVERMQTELSFDTVLTAFGMTECVVGTMCRPGDPAELVANTCGPVVPGLELRIARPGRNDPLPPGEEGELLFRGDTVMLGYLDDPDATAEAIDADGWLHTGDVGRVDDQGYLKVTDRLKDMYISGGFNVYPAEVEQVLARLDGVVESAVVGVPDERMGEVGKAYVVRRAGASLTEDDVVAFLKDRLANFKVPRSVEFLDVLPRNLAGKVLKRELRSK